MGRMVGTVSRGLRAPIIRSGDDLSEIVCGSVMQAVENGEFEVRDRDIIAMTEAIVARAQGNYAAVSDIAADVREKLGGETYRRHIPDTQPQPLRHLPARHCRRREKGRAHAVLSV